MDRLPLSEGERALMRLLWKKSPLTILDMAKALEGDAAWTKATLNIMLNRLADKGAVGIDAAERAKRYYPLLARENTLRREASDLRSLPRPGGVSLSACAMAWEERQNIGASEGSSDLHRR